MTRLLSAILLSTAVLTALGFDPSPDNTHHRVAAKVPNAAPGHPPPAPPVRRGTVKSESELWGNQIEEARSLQTTIPQDLDVVRSPSHHRYPSGDGIGAFTERSIEDWETEDLVLLATVDGALYARKRNTGQQIWELFSTQPVVETVDHREEGEEDVTWIVEPAEEGRLYLWSEKGGLTVSSFHAPRRGETDWRSKWDLQSRILWTG